MVIDVNGGRAAYLLGQSLLELLPGLGHLGRPLQQQAASVWSRNLCDVKARIQT